MFDTSTVNICKFLGLLSIALFLVSCIHTGNPANDAAEEAKIAVKEALKASESKDSPSSQDALGNTQIFTNSIYGDKKYKILLSHFSNEKSYFENEYNTVFQLSEFREGTYLKIYSDTIQQHFEEVLFEDFTNDGIPEILVENISDVRSNVTYYLYKIDPQNSKITKIKGFENIKNPVFLPEYNLITNLVMSGRNWTCFYEIKDNQMIEYEWCAEQGEDENGIESYDKDYDTAIQKILELRKKNN